MSKILIVDDDKSIHVTIAGILKKEGYNVDVMENGYKALEAVKKSSYDIALVDIRMPGINGVETFKKLKNISPETTVIMMTAYALEDLKKEALNEGAYNVIDKPFDMKDLIESLEDIDSRNIVLVVDDDLNFRTTMKYNLEHAGFKAINVENGDKALKAIERKLPDVIILDCIMPGLSGSQTMEKINEMMKNSEKKPEVILVSGYKNNEEIEKGLSLGARKFFEKPLDLEELKNTIEDIIKGNLKKGGKKKKKILVVDDETYFRNMLSDTLRSAGYSVKEAEDGRKALELMKDDDCKAVLLDIKLPDISGIKIYEKIRRENPEKKVIMMTAYAKDRKLMEEIKQGDYTCLVKPFKTSKLLEMIRDIVENKDE